MTDRNEAMHLTEPHNGPATVYVYQHSSTGQIRAHYIEAANEFERSESRWEWLHVASIEPRLFIQEHYATVSDGQHAAERHQFIKPLPEPFGYVSDWFGGPGVRFQREPYPELHQLTHSVASVYSVSQLMRSAHDAHTAGRDQGLREAAAKVRAILADCEQQDIDDPELEVIAAAIEQLRGK